MGIKVKYFGKSVYEDAATDLYKFNGISVAVSTSDDFVMEKRTAERGKKVITVSFSNKNKPIPADVIEYALRYFGIDTEKEHYINIKPARDYIDNTYFNIIYYEQYKD